MAQDIIQPNKKIYQLSLDEVETECVKLGLMSRDDTYNKSECLIKLMNFLLTRGFTSETFDFSPGGQTKFPEKLLIRNEIKSECHEGSKQIDTSGCGNQRNKLEYNHGKDVKPLGQLPKGWQVVSNSKTGIPVALLNPGGTVLPLTQSDNFDQQEIKTLVEDDDIDTIKTEVESEPDSEDELSEIKWENNIKQEEFVFEPPEDTVENKSDLIDKESQVLTCDKCSKTF